VGGMLLILKFGIKLQFVNNFETWAIKKSLWMKSVHEYYTKGRYVLLIDVSVKA